MPPAGRGARINTTMSDGDVGERERLQNALESAERRQIDLEQRFVALVAASGTLFGSLKVEDVLPGVILLASTLIPADGYALWRLDPVTNTWKVGAAKGISDKFSQRIVDSYNGDQETTMAFYEPLAA